MIIMRVIFVRHGEAEFNVKNILHGHSESPLTKKGIMQAKLVAKRLQSEKIHHVYASPNTRAKDTAEAIAKHHNIALNIKDTLRERNLGVLDGQSKSILLDPEMFHIYHHGGRNSGVESRAEATERAKVFLDELKNKHKDETILIVSHGGFGRAFLSAVLKVSYKEAKEWDALHNSSVTIVDIYDDESKVAVFNSIDHLTGIAGEYNA